MSEACHHQHALQIRMVRTEPGASRLAMHSGRDAAAPPPPPIVAPSFAACPASHALAMGFMPLTSEFALDGWLKEDRPMVGGGLQT